MNFFNKMSSKNKTITLLVGILLIISIFIGVSYAYFVFSTTQSGSNRIGTDCFKISFDGKNSISLLDTIPLSDEEASSLPPYEFTIKNICSSAADYDVNIETLNDSTLSEDFLKIKLDNDNPYLLGTLETLDSRYFVNQDVKGSRNIATGVLLGGEEKTYKLRMWIDEDSTYEESADKVFMSKVVVSATLRRNPYNTIALHTNGGYLENNVLKSLDKRSFGTLPEPVRAGYVFTGWYSDEDLTIGISAEDISNNTLTDLYADYVIGTYELTVKPEGGTYLGTTNNYQTNINYGSIYNLESISRYGYDFAGWEVETGNETTVNNNVVTMGTEDSIVKANWSIHRHKLTIVDSYTCDGEYELDYGEEYTLCIPTRDGYTFTGWDNTTNISGVKYTMDDADETITAQWTINNYDYIAYHYLQNVDGIGFTLEDTDTYNAEFDEVKIPPVRSYTGFTSPSTQSVTITSGTNEVNYYYTRNQYDLTINPNTGLYNGLSTNTVYEDVYYNAEVSIDNPSKVGYNFNGWSETLTDNKYTMPDHDVTLTASWTARDFTITYNLNGGNAIAEETKTVTYDGVYGALPEPTRKGYTFTGWYLDNVTKIESTDTVQITENKTAYAHWEANEYTVTFEPNGGTLESASKKVIYDDVLGFLPEPVKSGYVFLGWFSDPGLTQSIDETTTLQEEGMTIYAKYKKDSYALTINPDSGTYDGSTGTKEVQVEFEGTYELLTPTRDGHTFTGWTLVSGTGTTLNGSTITMGTQASVVKANWSKNSYTLTVNPNGGSYNSSTSSTVYTLDYADSQVIEDPTYYGYTFTGWTKSSDRATLADNTLTIGSENCTLTANWTPITFNWLVNHNKMNVSGSGYFLAEIETGSGGYNTTFSGTLKNYTGFINPTQASKTIDVDKKPGEGNAEVNTLDYNYVRTKNTLTIDPKGGLYESSTNVQTYNDVYYESTHNVPSPTKTGYDFKGWIITGANSSMTDTVLTMGTENTTLDADWEANTYTVTFNVAGGDALDSDEMTVTYDQAYGTLPEPTRTGYDFDGWFTESIGGSQVQGSDIVNILANQTLYAHWTIRTYNVSIAATNATVNEGSTIGIDYSSTGNITLTPAEGYFLYSAKCSGGYTTNALTGTPATSEQTITISNNGYTNASTCTFVAKELIYLSTYIKNLPNSDSVIQEDETTDKNMRYVGNNPDNYVYLPFADGTRELFRIIGVFNSNTNGSSNKVVKLVKDSSIGKQVYNSSNSNNWDGSTLQTKLNGSSYKYVNSNNLESVTWKTGAISWNNAKAANGISTLYVSERGNTSSSASPYSLSVNAKVGLPYISDFAYSTAGYGSTSRSDCLAAALNVSGNTLWKTNKNDANKGDCAKGSWMMDYAMNSSLNLWTLSNRSDSANQVYIINSNNTLGALERGNASDSNAVLPTVYLKEDVYCTNCNDENAGSRSVPFELDPLSALNN